MNVVILLLSFAVHNHRIKDLPFGEFAHNHELGTVKFSCIMGSFLEYIINDGITFPSADIH